MDALIGFVIGFALCFVFGSSLQITAGWFYGFILGCIAMYFIVTGVLGSLRGGRGGYRGRR